MIKAKAEQSLTDIHKRHSGFIHVSITMHFVKHSAKKH